MLPRLREFTPKSGFVLGPTDRRDKTKLRERFPSLSGRYAGCDEHSDPYAQGLCTVLRELWLMFGETYPEAFLDGNRWDDAIAEADRQLSGSEDDVAKLRRQFPKLDAFLTDRRVPQGFRDGTLTGFVAALELLTEADRGPGEQQTASGDDDDVFGDLADKAAADAGLDDAVPAADPAETDDADEPPIVPTDRVNFVRRLADALARFQAVPNLTDVSCTPDVETGTLNVRAYVHGDQLDAAALVALAAAARGGSYRLHVSPTGRLQVLAPLTV